MSAAEFPLGGFKECDIRGTFGADITPEVAYRLGRAIATLLPDQPVIIGGDFRTTTVQLMGELRRGLLESGARVLDVGQLSTPGYYFARQALGVTAGVMVTASHSPSLWNGFKPILGELPIMPDELDALRDLAASGLFREREGTIETLNIKPQYVNWLLERFAGLAGQTGRMVFDCGSGAAGWALGDVIRGLKLDAVSLLDRPDGLFPFRTPDISGPEDLADLQQAVVREQAALGFGFDGDGDRVGLVDELGQRVPSDRLIAWLAGTLVRRNGGGDVVLDLKLSQLATEEVTRAGGTALPQRSGHTFIKRTLIERGALLGGEYSGHIFFGELSGIDDALFAALLMASLMAEAAQPASQVFGALPSYAPSPDIRIRWQGDKTELMERTAAAVHADGAKCLRLDGVKAVYANGWALLRPSVTEPALTLRFEGRTPG
ncbi:MAG TPA: phosphomannomutase/phosphoglucomutase, partial [Candidatus Limnocylindrales bacterium]|nr:phosphomannomutase/phosphoglucomutase [Candidatus Limnocylindrales bacterium]